MAEYKLHTEWWVAADPDSVYAVLRDVGDYPRWWPQVVEARQLDPNSGELRCRSVLPYDVVFVVRREDEDAAPNGLVLRARLIGDLAGTVKWTVRAEGTGSAVIFDEALDVHKRVPGVARRLVRPAVILNHEVMMRGGERGLRNHFARAAQDRK